MRRLQGLQVAEVVLADCLQALGEGGCLEAVGQVVKPVLILRLEVNEGLDGITPALRPAAAVLRPAVVNARLPGFTALAEAPRIVKPGGRTTAASLSYRCSCLTPFHFGKGVAQYLGQPCQAVPDSWVDVANIGTTHIHGAGGQLDEGQNVATDSDR